MQYKLPDRIFGISTKEAYERYLKESEGKKQKPSARPGQPAQPLHVKTNISLSDYIQIPNTTVLIAKELTHKGSTWEDAHYALADSGLFMPSPALFMPYFLQVKEAAEGKITLHNGTNRPVTRAEARELWDYFSSATNRPKGDCWTWLDALFRERSGNLVIETDHRVVVKNGKKEFKGIQSPLEKCVMDDSYASLVFNKQGLPTKKIKTDEYKQGKNIYSLSPIEGRVAGFFANSGGAVLYCNEGPSISIASLGVFACAEGTPRSKK